MIGITSYGAYIPATRLPLALIGGTRGEGGPEKSIASYDEDAITMAVSSAIECLRGFDRAAVDAAVIWFVPRLASSSSKRARSSAAFLRYSPI